MTGTSTCRRTGVVAYGVRKSTSGTGVSLLQRCMGCVNCKLARSVTASAPSAEAPCPGSPEPEINTEPTSAAPTGGGREARGGEQRPPRGRPGATPLAPHLARSSTKDRPLATHNSGNASVSDSTITQNDRFSIARHAPRVFAVVQIVYSKAKPSKHIIGWGMHFSDNHVIVDKLGGPFVMQVRSPLEVLLRFSTPKDTHVELVWVTQLAAAFAPPPPSDTFRTEPSSEMNSIDHSKPIGPQIYLRKKSDPLKRQAEDILADLWLEGASNKELTEAHHMTFERVADAVARGCARKPFNDGRPWGPQIRERDIDDPVRVEVESKIVEKIRSGFDVMRLAYHHQLGPSVIKEILSRHDVT